MIQYILTDIEGTTTSVSFVFEVLFPYFAERCEEYIHQNLQNPLVRAQLEKVKETVLAEENLQVSDNEAIAKLLEWTKNDRKHPALKTLQGYLWRIGYENQTIKGHIYPDVPPVLEKWQKSGLKMGIYSSGSVEAQKLIFGFSDFGDLNGYFSHYFDTAVGHKREAKSYQNIQQVLDIQADAILFLSDIEAELDAAQAAGLQTIQLVRGKTEPSNRHQTVNDFSEISI